jgi:hypothetical protein
VVEGKAVLDPGTRQWTPEDDLRSARLGLQRQRDSQRARRNVVPQRTVSAALAQITLSYEELVNLPTIKRLSAL